jgi:cyclopropane fatty-acyl-phospholipid synthase-like methyltransferase
MFISQSNFPYLWMLMQNLIGGTKDKQRVAIRFWRGQKRILEIGCSVGNIADGFSELKDIEYTGIDIDSAVIEVAKKRFSKNKDFNFECISVEDLALKGIHYDYIIVAGMLHHVDDPTAFSVLEATRSLSSKESIVVIYDKDMFTQDDTILFKTFTSFEQGKFVRSHKELKSMIQKAGMQITEAELHPVRIGSPLLPVVARISLFIAQWPNI